MSRDVASPFRDFHGDVKHSESLAVPYVYCVTYSYMERLNLWTYRYFNVGPQMNPHNFSITSSHSLSLS